MWHKHGSVVKRRIETEVHLCAIDKQHTGMLRNAANFPQKNACAPSRNPIDLLSDCQHHHHHHHHHHFRSLKVDICHDKFFLYMTSVWRTILLENCKTIRNCTNQQTTLCRKYNRYCQLVNCKPAGGNVDGGTYGGPVTVQQNYTFSYQIPSWCSSTQYQINQRNRLTKRLSISSSSQPPPPSSSSFCSINVDIRHNWIQYLVCTCSDTNRNNIIRFSVEQNLQNLLVLFLNNF